MRSRTILLLAAALATAACDRQSPAPEQANVATPDEVTSDEVTPTADETAAATTAGKVDRSHKGEAAPTLAFVDPAGKKVTLADFRGKPLLLNVWATWCAPCVKELPSLDAAAGGGVPVLAVSQDMRPELVAPFFAAKNLAHLKPYVDAEMGLSLHYKVNLPTSVMYDAQGRELWRVSGAMDWTGAEAKALLAEG